MGTEQLGPVLAPLLESLLLEKPQDVRRRLHDRLSEPSAQAAAQQSALTLLAERTHAAGVAPGALFCPNEQQQQPQQRPQQQQQRAPSSTSRSTAATTAQLQLKPTSSLPQLSNENTQHAQHRTTSPQRHLRMVKHPTATASLAQQIMQPTPVQTSVGASGTGLAITGLKMGATALSTKHTSEDNKCNSAPTTIDADDASDAPTGTLFVKGYEADTEESEELSSEGLAKLLLPDGKLPTNMSWYVEASLWLPVDTYCRACLLA